MEIRTIEFEHHLLIIKNGKKIKITPFSTLEPGNIKLGIDAPKNLSVNREEIYKRKQEQLKSQQ